MEKLKAARLRRADLERSIQETPCATPTRDKPPHRGKGASSQHTAAHPAAPLASSTSTINPGEQNSKIAFELLESVKMLQHGKVDQFGAVMAKVMAGSQWGGNVEPLGPKLEPGTTNLVDHTTFIPTLKKAESLPNVRFDDRRADCNDVTLSNVIGSARIETTDAVNAKNVKPASIVTGTGAIPKRGNRKSGRASSPEEGQCSDSEDEQMDHRTGKKLRSGILTKPDEAGIKVVVQYAHEKLDTVHVKDRVFAELSFHFFVAGELEIALQDDRHLRTDEKIARLHFLKVLCYHKEYLDVNDLKNQYVANLQAIERGEASWSDYKHLAHQLHTNLTFRATVKSRERENAMVAKLEKLVAIDGKKSERKPVKSENISDSGKVIYCMDYNRGVCQFHDHHEGNFNRKPVTKWHICRKCLLQDGHPRRSHPETDPACPVKNA